MVFFLFFYDKTSKSGLGGRHGRKKKIDETRRSKAEGIRVDTTLSFFHWNVVNCQAFEF